MNQIRPRNRAFGGILFLIYLLCLVYFLFFSETFGRTAHSADEYAYNIVLFREITRYWTYRHTIGMLYFVLNIFGNIAAFVPFGFFLPIVSFRRHSFLKTVFYGAIFSLAVETTQLISHVGSFDVDDILLNTIGTAVGFIVFLICKNTIWKRKE